MKQYQVWAIPTDRAEGDTSLWHQLGETDDINEAFLWMVKAKENTAYSEVQVTQSVGLMVILT